ncbi:MAG: carboxypeptidase-like regulatory domain-containing protein [Rhodanobacteraceae bacterium]
MYNNSPICSITHRLARGLAMAGVIATFAVASVSTASAQSTAGSIFGKAPAGDRVTVHSNTGAGRTVTVDARGTYRALSLPMGKYTVTLKHGDMAVAKHINVQVTAGRGSEVDFNCVQNQCGEMASGK